MNPFDTLGVEACFDLDMTALEGRHRVLSGTLHPDRYAGKPAAERRMALDKAIEVNTAWRTLRDPVRRAESLLGHHGIEVGEQAEPKPSPALLMEMMEAREELEAAKAKRDLDRIGKVTDEMRAREKDVLSKLSLGFERAQGDVAVLEQLVPLLGELRYVRRLFEELDAIEDELMQ